MYHDDRLPPEFWAKVVVAPGGCWVWTAYRDRDGYGRYGLPGCGQRGKRWRTHRLTYTSLVGEIPCGLQVDHLCRNRACVNPRHLDVVTARENVDRGTNYVARNRRRTHCPKGHPYAGENLVLKPRKSGGTARVCRTCRNSSALEAWRRKAGKGDKS